MKGLVGRRDAVVTVPEVAVVVVLVGLLAFFFAFSPAY
jgi:hypothetical protein